MKKNIISKKISVCFRIALFGILISFAGCMHAPVEHPSGEFPKPYRIKEKWYQPIGDSTGFAQSGFASWYGKDFHGKKTANGEIYDMYAMTAAHKTLPLGTRVKVYNINNKKNIEVRINDRGPFVEGRIIDLSYTAAKKLGMYEDGIAPVHITALSQTKIAPKNIFIAKHGEFSKGNFYIQIGAFREKKNAETLKNSLPVKNKKVIVTSEEINGDIYYKVKIIGIKMLSKAVEYEKYLLTNGYNGIFIVSK